MKRILTAVVLGAVLVLTGCVPSEAPSSPFNAAAREALDRLAGLSREQKLAIVNELAAASEADARQVWGVDEALGGAAAATELFDDLLAPLGEFADDYESAPPAITLANYRAAGVTGGGAAFGIGFVLIGQLGDNAIQSTNDGTVGSERTDLPGGSTGISATPDGAVTVDFSTSDQKGGAEISIDGKSELQPCPDPDGQIELTTTISVRFGSNGAGGTIELEVTATGTLDDNAKLATSDYSYRQQYSAHSGGKGEFLDHSGSATGELTFNRSSSSLSEDFIRGAARSAIVLADFVANDLLKAAEKGWESGRCIDLKLTPSEDPGSLEPDSEVTIVASPRGKYDHAPAGGTVISTLSSGRGSIDPEGSKVDAEATFTYTAPSEKKQGGTVAFESRSKRGVGKATLDLATDRQAYTAFGYRGEFTGRGTICSLTSEFVITGDGLTFTFTPEGSFSGTVEVTGLVEGSTFTGSGTYNVDMDFSTELARNLATDVDITATIPDGTSYTAEGDIDFALTPTAPCD